MQPVLGVEFSLNYLKAEVSEEFEENNAGVVKSGCAHLMFPGSDMSGWARRRRRVHNTKTPSLAAGVKEGEKMD